MPTVQRAPARKAPAAPAPRAAARPAAPAPAPAKRGPGRPPKMPATNGAAAAPAAAPARPGRPGRPGIAPAVTGRAAAPAAVAAPVESAKLAKEIDALKATILRQNATIEALKGKATSNVRTTEQITDGGTDGLPAKDWRQPYQGAIVQLYQYETDKDANLVIYDGATEAIVDEDGNDTGDVQYVAGHREENPALTVLLAVPRTDDVTARGHATGTQARVQGMIACHFMLREDSTYEGAPEYLTEAQLASLWHPSNG